MDKDKKKLDWKPAFELFSQVSAWIVAPIVLALVFGKMLDARYGTEPIIFLVLAGVGFLVTCAGIIRVVRKYIKKLKEIADKSPQRRSAEEAEEN
ncbi:AtpZ/AtpI family protein [Candidatus Nomurabacteria bacterium]|nr:AtpZ/AtpI family protein [Candidatus Nomurabacteria bacterium]